VKESVGSNEISLYISQGVNKHSRQKPAFPATGAGASGAGDACLLPLPTGTGAAATGTGAGAGAAGSSTALPEKEISCSMTSLHPTQSQITVKNGMLLLASH
jgi:hypothetical protein